MKDGFNKLMSIENVTLVYVAITTVMTLCYWQTLDAPMLMIGRRIGVVAYIATMATIYRKFKPKMSHFMSEAVLLMRWVPLLLMLIVWYPETYEYCSQRPYQDHLFAEFEQFMFGEQPALTFSKEVTSTFWSEVFCLGYYSYYYLMAITMFYFYFFQRKNFDKAGFIYLASFFTYYLVYEFVPVAGPQYYFGLVGEDCFQNLNYFPKVGDEFRTYSLEQLSDMMLKLDVKGVFSQLVVGAQEIGERPTAAFPSSHVGMTAVCLLLSWGASKRLFWFMLPLFLLLFMATVYIKAHYLIDSICGLISAIALFYLTNYIYENKKH